ncbi:phenylacetate-CoA ligase [Nitrosospira sp. Nsp1]|nr:phenylacetate-CoA ligase [Nitrosospira sp. Nsp1]
MLGHRGFFLIDMMRRTSALDLLCQLESVQFESPVTIQQRQKQSLTNYFDTLRDCIPLYANYHSFEQLPVIDKAFANRHRECLMNPGYSGKRIRKKTGGSTGEPFVYFTGTSSQSYLWAGILLSWRVTGYRLGEPVAFFAGSSLFGTGYKEKVYHKLMNITLFSAFDLSQERMRSYAEAIASGGFRLLYGYASAIYQLARHILGSRRLRFALRGIVCTAEVLTPVMRETIETAFSAPCLNQYGCNDGGVSAYECELKQGLHLITTRSYPEVLESGKLISTDLSNQTFFLPRYDTGDLVVMDDNPCPCGRGFPLIREVIGRSNDLVFDQAGSTVHSEFFTHMFREDGRILAFQVLYDRCNLVVNLHCREAENAWLIYRKRIQAALVFDNISFVENLSFVPMANGKHRFVMRVDDVDAALAATGSMQGSEKTAS